MADSARFIELQKASARDVKSVGMVGASTSLEMVEYIRTLETAIFDTLDYFNGREYEMGDRCTTALSFIKKAVGHPGGD